jgi:hypothetical protein
MWVVIFGILLLLNLVWRFMCIFVRLGALLFLMVVLLGFFLLGAGLAIFFVITKI